MYINYCLKYAALSSCLSKNEIKARISRQSSLFIGHKCAGSCAVGFRTADIRPAESKIHIISLHVAEKLRYQIIFTLSTC